VPIRECPYFHPEGRGTGFYRGQFLGWDEVIKVSIVWVVVEKSEQFYLNFKKRWYNKRDIAAYLCV
jgi:hypothetical protein